MSVKTGFIRFVLVLSVASVAVPAAAQQPVDRLGAKQIQSLFATEAPKLAPVPASVPRAQGGDTPMVFRVHGGGVFCCSDAGFILGAGVGARPFDNQQIEIVGDFSFLRFNGHNGVYVSGNGLYHFKMNDSNLSPFAGAGLAILHISEETEVRFQIVGGAEFNKDKANPIRPEVRFIFTEGDVTTVLMVSIGIGSR